MEIDVRERLIEQQNLRIVEQGPGERHALPHALGILAYRTRECGIQADGANHFARNARSVIPYSCAKYARFSMPAHLVVKQ